MREDEGMIGLVREGIEEVAHVRRHSLEHG
jgi:hypothetical protein